MPNDHLEVDTLLFHDIATHEMLKKKPSAPSTALAQYVLTELPKDIEAWDNQAFSLEELAKRHTALLQAERERLYALEDSEEAAVAQLDLLMLLDSYLPAKEAAYELAPPILLDLLAHISSRHHLPARLTYELIVDVNTTDFLQSGGNIRVFSRGKIGRVERDFYIGHYFAERHIRTSYESLRSLVQHPAATDKRAQLRSILTGLERFTAYMAVYRLLPADSYAYFRRFLKPYPDNIKNASGAFMPTPQLFETLLHNPDFAQTEYLHRNLSYFPRWAQADLQAQIEAKVAAPTVRSLLADGTLRLNADERQLMNAIIEQFVRFKLTHIKVISSKIPEAFPNPPTIERKQLRTFQPLLDAKRDGTGVQQGTGGFAPQDFLADGVRRLLDLQTQLQG